MPREYIRKRNASYSDASLMLALKAIKNGKTIYAASREYQIPYHTLRRWSIKAPKHRGQGREPWLSKEEEKCIVDSLKFLDACGLPYDRKNISNIIETYFKLPNKRASPFGNKPPGHDYIRNFEKRWSKELANRKLEILTNNRASYLTKETVDAFFKKYSTIIEENDLQEHPERIFTLAEVGLGVDDRHNSVFVPKKSPYSCVMPHIGGKTIFSVLFCVSAIGNYLPPFIVYKDARLYETWTKNGPSDADYAVTESGWMKDSTFESWIKHFVNHTKDIKKPILLIYDGHGSHMTFGTIATAQENGIIILCLPVHSSHALQPLNVAVFESLKQVWKEILNKWFCESGLQNVSEADFPSLLKQLTEKFSSKNAVKGFQSSGLYPVKTEVKKQTRLQEFHNKSSTSKETVESIPSVSKGSNKAFADSKSLKELRQAILSSLSPSVFNNANFVMKTSKLKRKYMQTTSEILTVDINAANLQKEHRIKKVSYSLKTTVAKKPSYANQKNNEEKMKSGCTITPFIVNFKK